MNKGDACCEKAEEEVGNIISEFRSLKERVSLAQERFDGLSVRLGDALKPSRPKDKCPEEEIKEDTEVSSLTSEMRALKGAVARLVADIVDVTERLDL